MSTRATSDNGKGVLVYGASTYGAVLRDLVADLGLSFAGFIDDWVDGDGVVGDFSKLADFDPACYQLVIGVGYKHMRARRELAQRLKGRGFDLPALVHPRAYVAASARLGEGAVVMAGALVDSAAELGALTVLWPGAIVSHHCKLAGNTFLCPGSVVCGNTAVGLDCFVGASATIVDGVSVPPSTFVKAGSVYARSGCPRGGQVTSLKVRGA